MPDTLKIVCVMFMRVITIVLASSLYSFVQAAQVDFIGVWQVELLTSPVTKFLLTIEQNDQQVQIFADGSPVIGNIQDSTIAFTLDVYDGGDALRLDEFSGELVEGKILGQYVAEDTGVPGVKADPVNWEAAPFALHKSGSMAAPDPEHFTGFWGVATRGIKKAITSYTPEGQMTLDNYKDMDDPINRCVNPGLLRTLRVRGGSPVDIFYENQVLKMDFPNDIGNAQRYIFLDGREFPEIINPTFMGYSIGHWEGEVLIIETRGFKPMYYNSNGAPISPEASLTERMWLTSDNSIAREYSFHDPKYYTRPLTNNGTLTRRGSVVTESYECDPHASYRILDVSGDLPEYFERAANWRQ